MKNMSLEKIAQACGGVYHGSEEMKQSIVESITTDSRQAAKGCLFVAIPGERVDGHDFIPSVFEKGALAVLSEKELANPAGPYIQVASSLEAVKGIAEYYRQQLDIKVVGITGSVGKTSTKEVIASVLAQKYNVLKTLGNFNNELGLPLTVFRLRDEHQIAVLEMGISHFGEMHRLAKVARPDICVITNIGLCHLENLGTRDGILKAKTECFEHMQPDGTVILNGDDDKLCTKKVVNGKPAIFYGMGKEPLLSADREPMAEKSIYATDVKNLGLDGMQAHIYTPEGDFMAHIPIPGEHNVYNALAGTAVGLQLGLTIQEIQQGIACAQTISGRTNVIHTAGMTVIDDCYNANPVSMKASIEVLANTAGRRIAVLGDMGELGENEVALHYSVGEAVGRSGIDVLFCAGKLASEYARAAATANVNCQIYYYETVEQLLPELLAFVKEGDTILVKASHFMQFPQIVEALSAKK